MNDELEDLERAEQNANNAAANKGGSNVAIKRTGGTKKKGKSYEPAEENK